MAESRMSVLGAGRLRAECLGLEQDGREQNIREPETAGKRKRRTAGKRCVFLWAEKGKLYRQLYSP